MNKKVAVGLLVFLFAMSVLIASILLRMAIPFAIGRTFLFFIGIPSAFAGALHLVDDMIHPQRREWWRHRICGLILVGCFSSSFACILPDPREIYFDRCLTVYINSFGYLILWFLVYDRTAFLGKFKKTKT